MKSNYAAWHIPAVELGTFTPLERLKHLLRYAVLAPSAHNTQPWEFSIHPQENSISVTLSKDRGNLPHSDKKHRQVYLSLGAAIENICAAAQAFGATTKVTYTRKKHHVADVVVKWPKHSVQASSKLHAITSRHTNRGPYTKEKISQEAFDTFQNTQSPGTSVHIVTNPARRKKIGTIARDAVLSLMDANFKRELSEWVHSNWTDAYTGMPAGVQGIPGPVSLAAKFIISKAPIEKDQAKKDAAQLSNGPVLIAICAVDDDQRHWIEAGRVFERICLAASAHHLSTSAYASVVEAAASREKLQKVIGTSEYPLALLRVGHAAKTMPISPRLPVDRVITTD